MIAEVSPSSLSGTIKAPPGKSFMQRAVALALLNKGTTRITNPGKSGDDLAAISIATSLGASIAQGEDIIIKSDGIIKPPSLISCGESGLSLRMFVPVISLQKNEVLIEGTGSLLKREIVFFDKILPLLGVEISTKNGYLPVKVKGPLIPHDITIDASSSSQYLTGLLFAFAAAVKEQTRIIVVNLKSGPYIDMTLEMLRLFGYRVSREKNEVFVIDPIEKTERYIRYNNEGDWSNAAFLLVAGAISGELKIEGLNVASLQGDKAILSVLNDCGSDIEIKDDVIIIKRSSKMKAFKYDATDTPDLFPPLAVLASYCEGTSSISGVSRLYNKESNRAVAIKEVFSAMGINVEISGDELRITGGVIQGAEVDGYGDHRIVMAATCAALGATGRVQIKGANAVKKSWPAFFQDMINCGAQITLN